jgi:hypothetical protein
VALADIQAVRTTHLSGLGRTGLIVAGVVVVGTIAIAASGGLYGP